MSLRVELGTLLETAAGFATVPMLLTTDPDGRPRASAVTVEWDGELAAVRAGQRSVANAAQRPLVSLLWPAPPGGRFALLVDGTVEQATADPAPDGATGRRATTGGTISLRATSAILHVVAR